MPSRKNRPGKHSTPQLRDLHAEEDAAALAAVTARHAKGVVYWAPDHLKAACKRLEARGDIVADFTPGAYRLTKSL